MPLAAQTVGNSETRGDGADIVHPCQIGCCHRIVEAGCTKLPECLDDDVEIAVAVGDVGDQLLVALDVGCVERHGHDLGRTEAQRFEIDVVGIAYREDHAAQRR